MARRSYPPPISFRHSDARALDRLAEEYGLTARPRRSRRPTAKEGAGAAVVIGLTLGAAWMLGRHFARATPAAG